MSAICLFDTRVVSPPFMADVTALHPCSGGTAPDSPFRMWSDEGALVISGSLEGPAASSLVRMLTVVPDAAPNRLIDLSRVTELDLRAVLGLERFARRTVRTDGRLVLRGARDELRAAFASPHISFA